MKVGSRREHSPSVGAGMDEVPANIDASGAGEVTVVIPVRDGGENFARCLTALERSVGVSYHLIVVDDGSTDGSAERAESRGARVLRSTTSRGPGAARNLGVKAARTPLLFFVDADVEVEPETLARACARCAREPDLDALFGSYDDQPAARGVVSRFRNLLHHYVHQHGTFVDDARPARTFWTGLGAIRRDVFLAHGGFDPRAYRRPAIEDIELGYRITNAGGRIVLARDVRGKHLKSWSLLSMIRTDIFQRGVPWMLLRLRTRAADTDLNVNAREKMCVLAVAVLLAALAATPWQPAALAVAAWSQVFVAYLNRDLHRFLAQRGGRFFSLSCLVLHDIYYVCCGFSVLIALTIWRLESLRTDVRMRPPRPKILGLRRVRGREPAGNARKP